MFQWLLLKSACLLHVNGEPFKDTPLFDHKTQASQTELIWVLRATIIVVGAIALCMGLLVQSVYGLFILCADFVYVILFPQLVAVIYIHWVNVYGSIVAFLIGLILRLCGGERVVIGTF